MCREPVAKGTRDGRRSVRATESGGEVQIHAVFPALSSPGAPGWSRHLGFFVEAAGVFFPRVPVGQESVVFVPAVGVQGRL